LARLRRGVIAGSGFLWFNARIIPIRACMMKFLPSATACDFSRPDGSDCPH
jgi:hypothetical protein